MRSRCYRKSDPQYKNYGALGVSVCQSWLNSFWQFVADVGERPAGSTLDRKDPRGNYEPGNCRWASLTIQNVNKRFNRKSSTGYKGVTFSKSCGKFHAVIRLNGKTVSLGYFNEPKNAAIAYDKACERHYGKGEVSTNRSLGLLDRSRVFLHELDQEGT
jgi:hypothetical protein